MLPAGEMMKTTTNLFTHLANSYLSGNGGMSECVSETDEQVYEYESDDE